MACATEYIKSRYNICYDQKYQYLTDWWKKFYDGSRCFDFVLYLSTFDQYAILI